MNILPRPKPHEKHQLTRISSDEWPDPEPLEDGLPPVEPFREDFLPESIRPYVLDVAERMQVPLDFPATAAVLTLAGSVNRRAAITPKEKDTSWVVRPNLYGGIIAQPGFMKSPVMHAFTRPLLDIEKEWRSQYAAQLEVYDEEVANCRASDRTDKPKKLTFKRLVTNDGTFEKIHELMRDNPPGLLVICDELTGWLAQLDKTGREGERAFYLAAWDGNTPHTMDRIARGTIHVPACCLSLFGAIQPDRLRAYLTGGDVPLADDGMIQRFQLLVWPDVCRQFTYVDRLPHANAQKQFARIVRQLTMLDDNSLQYRFDPEAQKLFMNWFVENEERVRRGKLSPHMTGHLAKFKSLFASLALLFELADQAARGSKKVSFSSRSFGGFGGFSTPTYLVSGENAARAYYWMLYLESHAARIYSVMGTPEQSAAKQLSVRIKSGAIGSNTFSCRDIEHKDWKGLNSSERVKNACLLLEKAYWLRNITEQSTSKGGRPSLQYQVNPKVFEITHT